MSITARIAAFATDISLLPPESALAVAKLSLVDVAAVALAGLGEPVARMTRALVAEEAGTPQAVALGLPGRVPARAAALVNGALAHALDYDDTHFAYVGHPSVAVFPAALAVAERQDASGAAFLEAALTGMEAACRIGHWLGTGHYNHGFHQTATAGAFGATVAAGRLLGLDAERMRHALGLCATRASGLKSQFGTMGKPFNAGIAAANGVECALLAAQGMISRPDGLECLQGFGDTHAGEGHDLEASLEGLGRRWWFEAVQHKLHACCHGTHAAIEALRRLAREPGVEPSEIEAVRLRVAPRWLRVCDIPAPQTGLEAKFSYRLTAAMALAGQDTARLDAFTDAACADPALLPLRDRVEAVADPAIGDTAVAATLRLRDGRRLEADFDLDAAAPFTERRRRIEDKARALLAPAAAAAVTGLYEQVDAAGARALADTLAALALPEAT